MRGCENGFGVLGSEQLAGLGGPDLKKERGALRTRMNNMWPWDVEPFAVVVDLSYKIQGSVNARLAVQLDCIVAP